VGVWASGGLFVWWFGRGFANRDDLITKYFIIAKDLCTYTTIIIRQDKTLRDHGDELPTQRDCGD
jgi:hypothetical protein